MHDRFLFMQMVSDAPDGNDNFSFFREKHEIRKLKR